MIDGKNGQIVFHIEKRPVLMRNFDKYAGIIKAFPNLKADETIKVPTDGMNKQQIQTFRQGCSSAIQKVLGGGIKVGTCSQNDFIYIYKK